MQLGEDTWLILANEVTAMESACAAWSLPVARNTDVAAEAPAGPGDKDLTVGVAKGTGGRSLVEPSWIAPARVSGTGNPPFMPFKPLLS